MKREAKSPARCGKTSPRTAATRQKAHGTTRQEPLGTMNSRWKKRIRRLFEGCSEENEPVVIEEEEEEEEDFLETQSPTVEVIQCAAEVVLHQPPALPAAAAAAVVHHAADDAALVVNPYRAKKRRDLREKVEAAAERGPVTPPPPPPPPPKRRRRRRQDHTPEDRLKRFQHQKHSLRIKASQVAAVAGYSPCANLPELMLDLVYQGSLGEQLRRRDAARLGAEPVVVTREQILHRLAEKAGAAAELRTALDVNAGRKKVHTVQEADKVKQRVVKKAAKHLSKPELAVFKEGVRGVVDTGFGKAHEASALDLYEELIGWDVRERNTEVRSWPFAAVEGTAVPTTNAGPAYLAYDHGANDRPYFVIRGKVDGIRDELSPSAGSWDLRRVIVECKHRTRRILPEPPLGDQIQAAVYCLMWETTEADILEVLRAEAEKSPNETKPNKLFVRTDKVLNEPKENVSPGNSARTIREQNENESGVGRKHQFAAEFQEMEESRLSRTLRMVPRPIIRVSRVSLDDPWQHRWNAIVLPRLRSFVDAAYKIRADDHLRRRLLSTSSAVGGHVVEEAWSILHEQCPWLLDCDTWRKQRNYRSSVKTLFSN